MGRLGRFVKNAGFQGIVMTAVVAVVLILAFRRDFLSGDWLFTVPVFFLAFGLAYLVRGLLVEYARLTATVLNVIAFGGIAIAIFIRLNPIAETLAISVGLAAFFGLYLGCYFWLLSDERVAIER